jgi:hypothetical protein
MNIEQNRCRQKKFLPNCLKNQKNLLSVIFLLCQISLINISAQESTFNHMTQPDAKERESIWSLETSLTFAPAAQIYMLKASYKFSTNSELGFGPAFQNWKNTDKTPRGQANAYTLLLSYRYFFWKNFHVELEFWPAYNHFNSFVDGTTYKGLELWVEYKLGYKVNLTNNLYINIQPGLAHGLWMQNKWPEFKEESTMEFIKASLIPVPQILVGWTF